MILHVFANRSNAGDWLSALAIQQLLRPLPVTELWCDEPFVDATLRRLARAGARDFVIIGGGGLFMDYFDPFWNGFAPLAKRLAFALWGVGHCDLKERGCLPTSPHLDAIVRHSRFCIVRDELTRTHLGDAVREAPVACPSMVAIDPPARPGAGLFHVVHPDVLGCERQQRLSGLVRECASASGVPYRESHHRFAEGDQAALHRILRAYAESEYVVSSRLHGCILAVAMGRKVLAISGDSKIEGFMQAAGLSEWICDLRDLDTLPVRLQRLHAQTVPREFVDQVRRRHRELAEQLTRVLVDTGAARPRPWAPLGHLLQRVRRHARI